MINLKSIDKRVQNTLLEKQRELSDHNPKGSGTIFSRTVWARVSTLFNGRLVSFFSDKDPTNINDSKSNTVYAFYRPDNSNQIYKRKVRTLTEAVSGETTPKYEESSAYYRPVPGVTSITTQYEGGLKSFRKTELSFIAWTYEDVSFMQNSFMAISNYVLLEYGWSRSDNSEFSKPYVLERLVGESSLFTTPKELFNDMYLNYAKIALESEGNQDVIMGRVSNFEYTTRADGGFDCSVTLTSSGAQLMKTKLPSIDEFNLSDMKVKKTEANEDGVDEFQLDSAQSITQNVKALMNTLPMQLDSFYGDITFAVLGRKLELDAFFLSSATEWENILKSNVPENNFSFHTIFHDETYEGGKKTNDLTDKVAVPQIYAVQHTNKVKGSLDGIKFNTEAFPLSENGSSEMYGNHFYVTLGWFKDNILNMAFGAENDKKNSIYKFRSTEKLTPEFIQEYGLGENPTQAYQEYLKNVKNNTKSGIGPSEDWMPSVRILNNPLLTTMRPFPGTDGGDNAKYCFMLPGQNYTINNLSGKDNDGHTKQIRQFKGDKTDIAAMNAHLKYVNENFPSFAVQTGIDDNGKPTYDYTKGYYRNILVHVELLKDAVNNAKNIEDIYKGIFKNLNYDYDYWDLDVVQDPIEQGKISVMDRNVTNLQIREDQDSDSFYTNLYSTPNKLSTTDENTTGEVFFFNIWENNSIVKDYKVTSKIPDEFKIVMAYSGTSTAAHNLGNEKYGFLGRIIHQQQKEFVKEKIGDLNEAEFNGILEGIKQGSFVNNFRYTGTGGIKLNNGKFVPVSLNPNSSLTDGSSGDDGLNIFSALIGGSTTVSNMTNFVNNSFRGKLDKGSTIIGKSNVKAKFIIDFAVDALKQHWKKKSGENDKNKDDKTRDTSRPVIDGTILWNIGMKTGVLNENMSGEAASTALSEAGVTQQQIENYTNLTRTDLFSENPIGKRGLTNVYSTSIGGMDATMRGLYKQFLSSTATTQFPNIPIEVEITIDGISGIEPGDAFQVGYLQESYLKYTMFQSIDVSHEVSNTGWYTTIKGIMRINRKAMGLFLPPEVKEEKPIVYPWRNQTIVIDTPSAPNTDGTQTNTRPTGEETSTIGVEPPFKDIFGEPLMPQFTIDARDNTSTTFDPYQFELTEDDTIESLTAIEVLEDEEEDDYTYVGPVPLGSVDVGRGMDYAWKKSGRPLNKPDIKLDKIIPLKNQIYVTGSPVADIPPEYVNACPPPNAITNLLLFDLFKKRNNTNIDKRTYRLQDELASNYPKYKEEWVVLPRVPGKVQPTGWDNAYGTDMLGLNGKYIFKRRQVLRDYAALHGYKLEEGSKISMNAEQVVR